MPARRDPPASDDAFDDDAALFRAAIGPVRELPATPAPPSAPKPRPIPRMARRDDDAARSEFRRAMDVSMVDAGLEAGDALRYRRDEVPPRVLQRLARGEYSAQEELDLHFTDASQAELLLRAFLKDAREVGLGCVRIIHGKGLHSDSRLPTIKNLVDRVLRHRADVLAYHSAPAAQGGSGAVLVLLAKAKR